MEVAHIFAFRSANGPASDFITCLVQVSKSFTQRTLIEVQSNASSSTIVLTWSWSSIVYCLVKYTHRCTSMPCSFMGLCSMKLYLADLPTMKAKKEFSKALNLQLSVQTESLKICFPLCLTASMQEEQ